MEMKVNRELFMAAAMAMSIPASPMALVGCGGSTASSGDTTTSGPAEERDCSVEDCSDLTGPSQERDCSVEDCSDLTGPAQERDCSVEDCSDLGGPSWE